MDDENPYRAPTEEGTPPPTGIQQSLRRLRWEVALVVLAAAATTIVLIALFQYLGK